MRHRAFSFAGMALIWGGLLGLATGGLTSARAMAATDVCDRAALRAAAETTVPAPVLLAIARVEAGRKVDGRFTPWPWTTNEGGEGRFFPSAEAALDHVRAAVAAGGQNIDLGCFQINLRWHGDQFASLDAMIDPEANARYAARFLEQLYAEFGNWDGAVGAYHSRQDAAASAYVTKVLAQIDGAEPAPVADPAGAAPRANGFPLLQPGLSGGRGSLFVSVTDRPMIPLFR